MFVFKNNNDYLVNLKIKVEKFFLFFVLKLRNRWLFVVIYFLLL